jgi:hypothetical protein
MSGNQAPKKKSKPESDDGDAPLLLRSELEKEQNLRLQQAGTQAKRLRDAELRHEREITDIVAKKDRLFAAREKEHRETAREVEESAVDNRARNEAEQLSLRSDLFLARTEATGRRLDWDR